MMEEPGSFSGNCISPMPDLGPEASILISFAILFKDTAICFKARAILQWHHERQELQIYWLQ
jgi:hypothetical protein